MTARELVIKLLLDSRGVSSGASGAQHSLDQVSVAANRTGKELQDATAKGAEGFERLASVAKRAFAVIGGLAFLRSTASQYLENAAAVGVFSESLGVNVEDMQAWSNAVDRGAGGSAQAFQATVTSLTASLAQIATTGTGRVLPFFNELGIKVTDAGGKAREVFDILPELAEKFEGLSKSESMGLGQKLGLDTGTIMLLQSGRRAVDDLIKRQKELAAYTQKDAEIANKAREAKDDLGVATAGVAAIFMRIAVPALTWLAEGMTTVALWTRKNETFVLAFFFGLAAVITMVALPAIKAFIAMIATAAAPFLPLILLVAGLALLVDDLIRYMRGGTSAFSDLWSQFGTGEEIAEKLRMAWGLLQEAGKQLFAFLISGIRTAVQVFGGLIDVAISLLGWFNALINLDFAGMEYWGGMMLDAIVRIIKAVGDLIAEFLGMFGIWEPLKDGFSNAAAAVLSAWESVKQWFKGFFGWIFDTWATVKDIPGSIGNAFTSIPGKAADAVSSGVGSVKGFFGFGTAAKAESGSVDNSRTNTRTTHIGSVNIHTNATDAQGIANDMGSALGNTVNQADGAFG
jgi:hypothetical protein